MRPSQVSRAKERLRWAIWAVVVLGVILCCIHLIDRPLAEFAADHRFHVRGIQFLIGIPGLLLGVALVVPIVGWILRVSASGWWRVVTPCSKAIVWTAAAVELALKPVFGRSGPLSWLDHFEFTFHWFGGRAAEVQSMPSGEAAILAATIGVFWVTLPRWRWAYLLIGSLEAMALVWFNWHFASDVVAGAAIGIAGAALAVSHADRTSYIKA